MCGISWEHYLSEKNNRNRPSFGAKIVLYEADNGEVFTTKAEARSRNKHLGARKKSEIIDDVLSFIIDWRREELKNIGEGN